MTIGINISKISKRADLSLQLSMSDEVIVNTLDQTFTCTLGDLRDAIHTHEQLTKHSVGLGNVNNTSDFNKPISLLTLEALDGKANLSHNHQMGDVEDLLQSLASIISALAEKAAIDHGHAMEDVTGLGDALDAKADDEHLHAMEDVLELDDALAAKAAVDHTHALDETVGLETALDGKADLVHKHVISDVCDLQDALDLRSVIGHLHCISDVKLLQDALDSKAAVDHGHIIDDVEGLREEFNKKSDVGHGHCIKDIGGLTGILESKSNADHNHSIADVALLQRTLDEKALLNHTHAAQDLSDIYLALAGKAATGHTHCASSIEGLDLLLGAKAALGHGHDINDVNLLQAALDGRSLVNHTHLISDTAGLQDILDNITVGAHTHIISETTGLQDALDGRSLVNHTHSVDDTTGLSDLLDDKADADHGHIIADTTGLQDALDGRSLVNHTHSVADTTGLSDALDGKSDTGHGHAISDVTGLQAALDSKSGTGHTHDGGTAPENHTHTISEVAGLQVAIDDKADADHDHVIADTTGLQAALDAKSDTGHGHVISDTAGLQAAIDAKADTAHTHIIGNVTGLQDALDGKAATGHGHIIADTTGLQDALDGRSLVGHSHAVGDITGLQDLIDGKAPVSHTHATSEITGLDASITAIEGDITDLQNDKADVAHTHIIANTTGLQDALDGKADVGHTHAASGGLMDTFLTNVTLAQPYGYYPLDDSDSTLEPLIGNPDPFVPHSSSAIDGSVYEKTPIQGIHSTKCIHTELDTSWVSAGHVFPSNLYVSLLIERNATEAPTQSTLFAFDDFVVSIIDSKLTLVTSASVEWAHPEVMDADTAYVVSVSRATSGKYTPESIVLSVNGVDVVCGYSSSAQHTLLAIFGNVDNSDLFIGNAQHLFLSNIDMDSALRAELNASYLGTNHTPEFENLVEGFSLNSSNAGKLIRVNSEGTKLEPVSGEIITDQTILTKTINYYLTGGWWGTCSSWDADLIIANQTPGYFVDHCNILHSEFFGACTHISSNPAAHKAFCEMSAASDDFIIEVTVDVLTEGTADYANNGAGGSGAIGDGCSSTDLNNDTTCAPTQVWIRELIGTITFKTGSHVGLWCIKDGADYSMHDKINFSVGEHAGYSPGGIVIALNTQQVLQIDQSLVSMNPGVVKAGVPGQSGTACS